MKKLAFLSAVSFVLLITLVYTQSVQIQNLETILAAPPASPYTLGETLAPTCAPGDTNCTVTTPAASGDNTDITSLSPSGNIGIGLAQSSANYFIHGSQDQTSIANNWNPVMEIDNNVLPTGNMPSSSTRLAIGAYSNIPASNSFDVGQVTGLEGDAENYGTGDVARLAGLVAYSYNDTAVNVTNNIGVLSYAESNAGSVTNLIGVDSQPSIYGGSATDFFGIRVGTLDTSGSTAVANRYGLYISDFAGTTTTLDYGIYQAGIAQENYFAGWVGIGVSDPEANLHLWGDGTNGANATLWWGDNENVYAREFGSGDSDQLHLFGDEGIFLDTTGEYVAINAPNLTDEEFIITDDGSSDTAIIIENTNSGTDHVYEIHVEDDDTFIIYENEIEDHTESVLEYDGTNNHIGFSGAEAIAGVFWNVDNGATLTNGGVWTDASSRELKTGIRSLTYDEAAEVLSQLNPVQFEYKAELGEQYLGFIAEDVPELVAMADRKGLGAMDIVAILVEVNQKQQEEIAQLKTLVCLDHPSAEICLQ